MNRTFSYDNPEAEYVNWLMDDDIFMPDKIEYMIDKFNRYKGLALVTSYRQRIDEFGNICPDLPVCAPIAKNDTMYLGNNIGKAILVEQKNFIGEPTTVLIKKSCLKNRTLGGRTSDDKYMANDFPTWLYCLKQGNLYYVAEPLSQYRVHTDQLQYNVDTMGISVCKWAMETLYEFEHKDYFSNPEDFIIATTNWFKLLDYYISSLECVEMFDTKIVEDAIKYAEMMIENRNRI